MAPACSSRPSPTPTRSSARAAGASAVVVHGGRRRAHHAAGARGSRRAHGRDLPRAARSAARPPGSPTSSRSRCRGRRTCCTSSVRARSPRSSPPSTRGIRCRRSRGPRTKCQWFPRRCAPSVWPMDTALITGASRGLGLALARELARRSWRLVIDARGAEALEAARAELARAHRGRGDPRRCRRPRAPRGAGRRRRSAHRPAGQQREPARPEPAAAARRLPARRARARLPRQRPCAAGASSRPRASGSRRPCHQRDLRRRHRGVRGLGAATAPRRRRWSSSRRVLAAEHPICGSWSTPAT